MPFDPPFSPGAWLVGDWSAYQARNPRIIVTSAHLLVALPGYPLLPGAGNPYISTTTNTYEVEDDCPEQGDEPYYAEVTALDKRTRKRYTFRSPTRCLPNGELKTFAGEPALKETLPLKTIERFDPSAGQGGEWVALVNADPLDDAGRSTTWKDATDPDNYVTFEYGAKYLTRAETGDNRILQFGFTEYMYGEGDDEQTKVNLTHLDADCSSCGSYDYAYDEGQLALVVDVHTNHTLAAYEYETLTGLDERVLTKQYHKPSGGNPSTVYEAVYAGWPQSITHYRYLDSATTQVTVELLDGDTGDVTKTRYYPELNPTDLSSGYDEYSYDFEYGGTGGTQLTKQTVTRPRENSEIYHYGTLGANAGRVTAAALYDGATEITRNEYSYIEQTGSTQLASETNISGGVADYEYLYDDTHWLTKREEPQVSVAGGGTVQQVAGYAYDYDRGLRTKSWLKRSDGTAVTTAYKYDATDKLTMEIQDPGGLALTTQYYYYPAVYADTVIRPDGSWERLFHNAAGLPECELTYVNGSSDPIPLTRYVYEEGRLVTTSRAHTTGVFDKWEYCDGTGTFIHTVYDYDPYRRVTQQTLDPGGLALVTTYEYDHQDRVTKSTMPDDRYERVERDGRGREIRRIAGNISEGATTELTTTYEYDGNSNRNKVTTPGGAYTEYEYDGYDLLTREIQHEGT